MSKPLRKGKQVGFDRFTESQFGPYVKAIGQLVLAWNSFHEVMGWSYEIMIADALRPVDTDKGPQVREGWNALNSDRDKRRLLRAAATNLPPAVTKNLPKFAEDVKWVLDRADELENMRNSVVHSPLMLVSREKGRWANLARFGDDFIAPEWLSGNRRAIELRNLLLKRKELLAEFRWCRDATLVCRDFMVLVNRCWGSVGLPWPKRPSLPSRERKNTRSRHPPHQDQQATQKRQPRSSRA